MLEIVKVPDPVLRQKAKKVPKVTPAVQKLLDDMAEAMRAAPGVGLAGPQVGALKRVIVVEVQPDEEEPEAQSGFYRLVNPEIMKSSKEMEEGPEGCLSIPGYQGDVDRHVWVEVRALEYSGRPFRVKARGYLARVLQHEIDHLDGILFLDRLTSPDKLYKFEPQEPHEEPA